jgi:hypothetical protein
MSQSLLSQEWRFMVVSYDCKQLQCTSSTRRRTARHRIVQSTSHDDPNAGSKRKFWWGVECSARSIAYKGNEVADVDRQDVQDCQLDFVSRRS